MISLVKHFLSPQIIYDPPLFLQELSLVCRFNQGWFPPRTPEPCVLTSVPIPQVTGSSSRAAASHYLIFVLSPTPTGEHLAQNGYLWEGTESIYFSIYL